MRPDPRQQHVSVLLVSLPWAGLAEPSLGLGILRAVLDEQHIPCRVLHLNIQLLRSLQALTYYSIANVFALNDFLFSGVLDPALTSRQKSWLRMKAVHLINLGYLDARVHNGADGVVERLLWLRNEVIPPWLEQCASEIARSSACLVGFTCMFDQTIASLALASLVKRKSPEKTIALGGYAVRPPTGDAVIRSFRFVDVICTGEGEPVIGPLARAAAGVIPLSAVPGILYRDPGGGISATPPPPQIDLNTSPVPNYEDFYRDLRDLAEQDKVTIEVERLPIENSRGCWWGAKHHCVFCGIHDADMVYRAKDAGKVLESLDVLSKRHNIRQFRFADYILPNVYYNTLLPELARRGRPYRITCELKSNVNAGRFHLLAEAGIAEAQPGIESFAGGVLREMDKGVSAVQNVYTLVLGKRHGVLIHYNLIYGFPSDTESEYQTMSHALRRLVHLQPPSTHLEVQITRYAPYQVAPERYGLAASTYEFSYDLIFSREFLDAHRFSMDDFCYYFNRPFENSPRLYRIYREIDAFVEEWRAELHRRERLLTYRRRGSALSITDSRWLPERSYLLDPEAAQVLLAASAPRAEASLARILRDRLDSAAFQAALAKLDELGLVFREGGSVVSIVIPSSPQDLAEPASAAALAGDVAGRNHDLVQIA